MKMLDQKSYSEISRQNYEIIIPQLSFTFDISIHERAWKKFTRQKFLPQLSGIDTFAVLCT